MTVLEANTATQLATDAPAGLNVTAPSADAYYLLPSEDDVQRHKDTNHQVRVYVFPSSDVESDGRTRGASTQQRHDIFEVTIALHVREELGAVDFEETWKDLTPKEREFRRCEALLGAFMDSIHANVRDGDDILQVDFVAKRSGDNRFKQTPDEAGTWGSLRYRVHQLVLIPQQN